LQRAWLQQTVVRGFFGLLVESTSPIEIRCLGDENNLFGHTLGDAFDDAFSFGNRNLTGLGGRHYRPRFQIEISP
jgi:hypothetical protein